MRPPPHTVLNGRTPGPKELELLLNRCCSVIPRSRQVQDLLKVETEANVTSTKSGQSAQGLGVMCGGHTATKSGGISQSTTDANDLVSSLGPGQSRTTNKAARDSDYEW